MKFYHLKFTWLYYRSEIKVAVDSKGIIVDGTKYLIGDNYKEFKDKIELNGRIDSETIMEKL